MLQTQEIVFDRASPPKANVSCSGSPWTQMVVWSLPHFGRQTLERTVDDAAAFIPLA